jgi:hypothetical protein
MDTRVDLYGGIHRGLRNLIARFSFQAGAVDWTDAAAVAQVATKREEVKRILDGHHKHEEKYIHPLLARIVPGGHRSYEADHIAQQAVLADLDTHLQGLRNGAVPAERRLETGLEFYRGFNLLYASYLQHMHREESEAQRALDELCLPQETGGALRAIMSSIPTDELLLTIDFMFPALTLAECIGLMAPMKMSAPPQVFAVLAERVRQARGEADWVRIKGALNL